MTVRFAPSRRQFLATSTAALAAGVFVNPAPAAPSKSPNEKLNLAFVGVTNKGGDNVSQLASQNVVALCDVDSEFLASQAQRFPQAKQFADFRRMLDEPAGIDAVVVSTADHTHAPATCLALTRGKPVYCEKPLTHTVEEARLVAQLAAKHKVATQMGTQIHAGGNYRRVVEIVQAGAIGPVKEVFNWCNKGWSDGRFAEATPAPSRLNWDLWLGPAKERPFSTNIHPANWRRFWEYGSGTFGDMAAHVMDLPFWALKLRHPTSVSAKGPAVHPDGAPSWCLADYEFPARGDLPAVKFHWSDGGQHHDLVKETRGYNAQPLSTWGLGVLFVGEKGMLAADYGHYELLPKTSFEGFQPPAKTIPESIGHWNEWVHACKTGEPTTCNFDYSGALTETILLGVAAYRCGERLEWDAANLKATNTSSADQFLRKEYRAGWKLAGQA